jgi:hypothetical protein
MLRVYFYDFPGLMDKQMTSEYRNRMKLLYTLTVFTSQQRRGGVETVILLTVVTKKLTILVHMFSFSQRESLHRLMHTTSI